jgi:hypothetical protein
MGNRGDGRKIADVQQWIGGCLQPDHAGVWVQTASHLLEVGRIHVREVQPAGTQYLLEQPVGAAINIVPGQHVIARREQAQDGIRRRQAGGKCQAEGAAFQFGQTGLQRSAGRVGSA